LQRVIESSSDTMLNPKDFKTCFGISSRCQDGKHIPFIDSDNKPYSAFVKDLLNMQNRFCIQDIYILKTENGYNAFTLDKSTLADIFYMLKDYKTFCKDHLNIGMKRGYLTLRMSRSKTIVGILPTPNRFMYKINLSLAHYLFFSEIMNFELLEYDGNLFDNLLKFDVIAYLSKKHGVPNLKIDNIDNLKDEEFNYCNR